MATKQVCPQEYGACLPWPQSPKWDLTRRVSLQRGDMANAGILAPTLAIAAVAVAMLGASPGCGRSTSGGHGGAGGHAGAGGGTRTPDAFEGAGGTGTGGAIGTGGTGAGGVAASGGAGGKVDAATDVSSGAGGVPTGFDGGMVDAGTDVLSGTGGVPTGFDGGMDMGGTEVGVVVDAPAPIVPCSQVTSQEGCDLRSDCHSVFVDSRDCNCGQPGCCARFDHCSDAAMADCSGSATCKMSQPYCSGSYVVAVKGSCYDGCVLKTACAPPSCPKDLPTDGAPCGAVDYACFYDQCTRIGRGVATCSAQKWGLNLASCALLQCNGSGTAEGTVVWCQPGQICVRTTGGGGAYTVIPSCVENTCTDGPSSLQCQTKVTGDCSASYSTMGMIVECRAPSSCGQGQGGCS